MKVKRLNEGVDAIRARVREYISDKLFELNDNLAIVLSSKIPEYDASWVADSNDDLVVKKVLQIEKQYIEAMLDDLFKNATVKEAVNQDDRQLDFNLNKAELNIDWQSLCKEVEDYCKQEGFTYWSFDCSKRFGETYLYCRIEDGDWKHDHIAVDSLVDEFFRKHPTLEVVDMFKDNYVGSDGDWYTADHLWELGPKLQPVSITEDLENDFNIYMEASEYKCKLRPFDVQEAIDISMLLDDIKSVFEILDSRYGNKLKYWKYYSDDEIDGYKVFLTDGTNEIILQDTDID